MRCTRTVPLTLIYILIRATPTSVDADLKRRDRVEAAAAAPTIIALGANLQAGVARASARREQPNRPNHRPEEGRPWEDRAAPLDGQELKAEALDEGARDAEKPAPKQRIRLAAGPRRRARDAAQSGRDAWKVILAKRVRRQRERRGMVAGRVQQILSEGVLPRTQLCHYLLPHNFTPLHPPQTGLSVS